MHSYLKDLDMRRLDLFNGVRQLPARIKAVVTSVAAFAVLFIVYVTNGFSAMLGESCIYRMKDCEKYLNLAKDEEHGCLMDLATFRRSNCAWNNLRIKTLEFGH